MCHFANVIAKIREQILSLHKNYGIVLTLIRNFGLSGMKINTTAEDKAGKENNATNTRHALISKLPNEIFWRGMIDHAPPAAIMLPSSKKLASVSTIGPRSFLDKNSA